MRSALSLFFLFTTNRQTDSFKIRVSNFRITYLLRLSINTISDSVVNIVEFRRKTLVFDGKNLYFRRFSTEFYLRNQFRPSVYSVEFIFYRKFFFTVSSISHENIKLVGKVGNKGNLSHRFFNFSRKCKARRKGRKQRKIFLTVS